MTMNIIAPLFLVIASLAVPVAAAAMASVKLRSAKPVLLGAACFTASQLLTRIPLLQFLLPMFAGYSIFTVKYPIINILLLSLSAGLFEEIGRYIFIKGFMKNSAYSDAVAFGIGHGGTEAALLVGINALVMLISGTAWVYPWQDFALSGLERIFTMLVHIALSVTVWHGVISGKKMLIPLAVLLHTGLNFFASVLMLIGVNGFIVEGVIAVYSAALMVVAYLIYKKKKGKKP